MTEGRWTPAPLAEREEAGRARRVVRHDAVALTAVPCAMLAATGLLVWAAGQWLEIAGLAAGMVLVPLDFWIALRIDARRAALVEDAHKAERLMREEFGDREGWLVDVYLHRDGATIGRDRGMLWAEDGRLMFSGGRTSFSLSPSQARGARRAWAIRGLRHAVLLDLIDGQGLSFEPRLNGAVDGTLEGVVLSHLRAWAAGSESGGQMPPASVGPGAPSPARLLGAALVATAFWAYLAGVAALVLVNGRSPALIALAALVGVPLHAWHPAARWRALLARRRLEREATGG